MPGDYDLGGGSGKPFASSMPAFRDNGNPIYDHLHCANDAFLFDPAGSFLAGPGLAKRTRCFKIFCSIVAAAIRCSGTVVQAWSAERKQDTYFTQLVGLLDYIEPLPK